MSAEAMEHDEWDGMGELSAKRICRFCLSQQLNKLSNIYATTGKSAAPLPSQVLAIASIEIHNKDGMPSWICSDCRLLFENAYCFKLMCKRADTLLRQYPLTGKWPDPLFRPNIADFSGSNSKPEKFSAKPKPKKRMSVIPSGPRKLLNSNPAATPEPPAPLRVKREKLDDETMIFLNKVENDEELSMDDVQRLIAASDDAEEEVEEAALEPPVVTKIQTAKPKVLNKSSIRILNKDAEKIVEPRISKPHVKWNDHGRMEIVTEILDPDETADAEPDPITTATPVETNVFPCPDCDRTFPLRQLRDIHMVNHNRERSFQCSGCEKSFFSKYDLQKHNLTHTGDKPFKCTICNKGFTRTTLLHRHEKTHADIPKFICIYCEKAFISKDEMEKHTERHLKNRPFICKVCQKAFAFKQGLERHEIVHSRVQPYPCQYCEQSFPTPTKLSRHLTAHAGKRPYPCKFCSKSYLMSHHLTRHLRSHKQGVAAFHCNDCDKIFKTRDELIFHSATHAAKTLVCPLCKEKFTKVETVTAHIKQHAEGEAFACEFCDMIFLTSDRLHAHTMEIHDDEMRAYQEDENIKAEKQSTVEKEEANEQSEGDLQYAIDEFLIFDGESSSVKPKQSEKQNDAIRKLNISKKPTILSQVVLQPKPIVGEKKNSPTSNDNRNMEIDEPEMSDPDYIEEEEDDEFDDEDDVPLKVRKTAEGPSPKIAHAVANEKPQDPLSLRGKVAKEISTSTLPKMPTLKPIKIEMDDLIVPTRLVKLTNSKEKEAIDMALKALPKSVSVRRKIPTVLPTTLPVVKQMPPPTPKFRIITRRSNREAEAQVEEAPKTSASKQPDTTKAASSTTKLTVEKLPHLKKNVTVQKIMISKAEADKLIKGGRIRMKDGNMVLTTQTTTKPKSSQ